MSASGKTNNLKLPIYVEGNETTSWADYNESMQKIDIFAGENKGNTDTNTDAIQTINDQLQTIVTEQNNNNETTQRLDSRVQAIDRNIVTINGTLSSHNQRIAALESEGGEFGSLVTTVAEHTTEIGQLKTDSTSQNTQIQKNKTDIETINTEITEIRRDVASAETDIASTNQNINQLTNRITTIENNANRMFNAKTIRGSYHLFGNIYHSDGTDNNISGNVSIVMNGSYIGSASNYNSDTPIKLIFAQIFDSSVISHSTTYIGANIIYTDNTGNLCTAGFSSIVTQNHGEAIWLYPLESITVNTGLITLEIHSSNSAT